MLSLEWMNIYDVLVLSGAGKTGLFGFPARKPWAVGTAHTSAVDGTHRPLQTSQPAS